MSMREMTNPRKAGAVGGVFLILLVHGYVRELRRLELRRLQLYNHPIELKIGIWPRPDEFHFYGPAAAPKPSRKVPPFLIPRKYFL